MPTKDEAAVVAVLSVLAAGLTPQVTREEFLPKKIPSAGVANVTSADPQEIGRRFSPTVIEWELVVAVSLAFQDMDEATRRAGLSDLIDQVGTALTDVTLGGVVDFMDIGAPEQTDTTGIEGGAAVIGCEIALKLYYETPGNPLTAVS